MKMHTVFSSTLLCLFSGASLAQWTCSGIAHFTSGKSVKTTGAGATESSAKQNLQRNCTSSAGRGFVSGCQVIACSAPASGGAASSTPAPKVNFCVARTEMSQPLYAGNVAELFGERAGVQRSCAVSAPGERISKVYCFMYNGYAKDVPADLPSRLKLPGCTASFFDTNACEARYAAVHEVVSYINEKDQHVVCADALGEKDSGNKGWGIIGGK